nr:hypothetical protein [uncultured Sulfurimonas sp.]
MSELTHHDIIGSLGVAIVVIAYFLLQINKLDIKNIYFSSMNAIGSIMILYSLFYNWNLASVLIESFWIFISFIGIYNYYKQKSY